MSFFPKAPEMGGGRSNRATAPCVVEDHQNAESAKVQEGNRDLGGGTPAECTESALGKSGGGSTFHTAAARVTMKHMYAARMARPDLLRSIAFLARYFTTWNADRD